MKRSEFPNKYESNPNPKQITSTAGRSCTARSFEDSTLPSTLQFTLTKHRCLRRLRLRRQRQRHKIARLLKRISIRLKWAMEDLTEKGIGVEEGKTEQVDEVRQGR